MAYSEVYQKTRVRLWPCSFNPDGSVVLSPDDARALARSLIESADDADRALNPAQCNCGIPMNDIRGVIKNVQGDAILVKCDHCGSERVYHVTGCIPVTGMHVHVYWMNNNPVVKSGWYCCFS